MLPLLANKDKYTGCAIKFPPKFGEL